MLARLGNVIYWGCAGVAALSVVGGIVFGFEIPSLWRGEPSPGNEIFKDRLLLAAALVVSAIGIWLIGRAARYVLAGR